MNSSKPMIIESDRKGSVKPVSRLKGQRGHYQRSKVREVRWER